MRFHANKNLFAVFRTFLTKNHYILSRVKHGLCEKCFESWKEQENERIQCLICGLDLAYDKSFLDGKVFILENDGEQINQGFKEQINDFFRRKNK